MKKVFILFLLAIVGCAPNQKEIGGKKDLERWKEQAKNVEIIRDDFGVPHIYGKSDADAVFGLLYAQCEDDFNRVERNYIWALGRLAEIEGEKAIYSDLRARLYMTREEAISNFEESPDWMQKLCIAFADGINYYLATHPEVEPKLLDHFEPWMPFYFSEGSIGGDIERVSTEKIKKFYDAKDESALAEVYDGMLRLNYGDHQGSNGLAISGEMTQSGKSMLLINPHTSFFFRGEVHVVSEEGLNAYGAVTWGQFFVYQGFNENTGWMHTSTGTDIIDEFEETIIESTEVGQDDAIRDVVAVSDIEVEEVEEDIEVPFSVIENVPVFPGCENKKGNAAKKKCMSEKVAKFVNKKFNTELASDLGLPAGRKRIFVSFKIDKSGNIVGVGARGPHPGLEKEAKRVISLLPKMKPGRQRGKSVIVPYSLPIVFQVQD